VLRPSKAETTFVQAGRAPATPLANFSDVVDVHSWIQFSLVEEEYAIKNSSRGDIGVSRIDGRIVVDSRSKNGGQMAHGSSIASLGWARQFRRER